MGGKNKQRTKGNVRPSSSARAAELVARDGVSLPPLMVFGADLSFGASFGSTGIPSVPVMEGSRQALVPDDSEVVIDGDIRLALRKLSKRDGTTRLKAMQETLLLFSEKSSEAVKAVLPYWPRIYSRLSLDSERRVRECTQTTHGRLAARVGRDLAPHLRAIMGPWLVAQNDPHAPAASAAREAFRVAFPLARQPHVLDFCKDSILTHITDNLFKQTPESLSDTQTEAEEKQAKYERVLSASLLALAHCLSLLPAGELSPVEHSVAEILGHAKFWKLARHKTAQVRGAALEAVATCCQYAKGAACKEAARLCPVALLALDENDPVARLPAWKAALGAATSITDCWKYVNLQKGFLPKLWAVLRAGGHGSAALTFPYLLPLFSLLPARGTTVPPDLNSTFFGNLLQGLCSENVMVGVLERSAIVTAFFECFLLVIHRLITGVVTGIDDGETDRNSHELGTTSALDLLRMQLLLLLEMAVRQPKLKQTSVFFHLALLVGNWHRRAHDPSLALEQRKAYTILLEELWDGIETICKTQVVGNGGPEGVSQLLAAFSSNVVAPSDSSAVGRSFIAAQRTKVSHVHFELAETEEQLLVCTKKTDRHIHSAEMTVAGTVLHTTLLSEAKEAQSLSSGGSAEYPVLDEAVVAHAAGLACRLARITLPFVRAQQSCLHFLTVLISLFPTDGMFAIICSWETEHVKSSSFAQNVAVEYNEKVAQKNVENIWKGGMEKEEEQNAVKELPVDKESVIIDNSKKSNDDQSFIHSGAKEKRNLEDMHVDDEERKRRSEARLILLESENIEMEQNKMGEWGQVATGESPTGNTETFKDDVVEMLGESDTPWEMFARQHLLPWLQDPLLASGRPWLAELMLCVLEKRSSVPQLCALLEAVAELRCGCSILTLLIQKAIADCRYLQMLKPWLQCQSLSDHVVKLAQDLCRGREGLLRRSELSSGFLKDERWDLLTLALTLRDNGQPLVSTLCIERILDTLSSFMATPLDSIDKDCASVTCDLATAYFQAAKGSPLPFAAHTMALALFRLVCQPLEPDDLLSGSLRSKLDVAWKAGLEGCLLELYGATEGDGESETPAGQKFLIRAAKWLRKATLSGHFCTSSVERVVEKSLELVKTDHQTTSDTNLFNPDSSRTSLIDLFLFHLLPSAEEWDTLRADVDTMELNAAFLEGRLVLVEQLACASPEPIVRPCQPQSTFLAAVTLISKLVVQLLRDRREFAERLQESTSPEISESSPCMLLAAHCLFAAHCCTETDIDTFLGPVIYLPWDVVFSSVSLMQCLHFLFGKAMELGGRWVLTLQQTLEYARSIGLQPTALPWDLPSRLPPQTESELQTMVALQPFISPEQRQDVMAVCVACLMTVSETERTRLHGGLGPLHLITACFVSQSSPLPSELLHNILDVLMEWRNRDRDIFLFTCNVGTVDLSLLATNVAVMRFLRLLLKTPHPLSNAQWDFLLCASLSWLQSAHESLLPEAPKQIRLWLFVAESCRLLAQVAATFGIVSEEEEGPDRQAMARLIVPPSLRRDWDEFFAPGAYSVLFPIFFTVAEQLMDDHHPETSALLTAIGLAVVSAPVQHLKTLDISSGSGATSSSRLPPHLAVPLGTMAPLLLSPHRAVQLAAYHSLAKLMPDVPSVDAGKSMADEAEEEESYLSPPEEIMETLHELEASMKELLDRFPVAEFDPVSRSSLPPIPTQPSIMGYLLAWQLVLDIVRASPPELRAEYSAYLRHSNTLSCLLQNLFRLMPVRPSLHSGGPRKPEATVKETVGSNQKEAFQSMFTLPAPIGLEEAAIDSRMQVAHLACWVYRSVLQVLPAAARLWWQGQEKRVAGAVESYTARHVSPCLLALELSAVQRRSNKIPNLTVRARPTAREVLAAYEANEVYVELLVCLPASLPLGVPTVECSRRVAVSPQQWRSWLLQLHAFLKNQNGSIIEGLELWKANVEKRFEGVEECAICFSIIHGTNCSLPCKACRTCRKKFHNACLYKWFSTSNKANCPLCRERFF